MEILRPGIQVHFFTAPDGSGGHKAVQMTLEPVASLDSRLRYVAKRAASRAKRRKEVEGRRQTDRATAASEQQEDIAFMSTGVSERKPRRSQKSQETREESGEGPADTAETETEQEESVTADSD